MEEGQIWKKHVTLTEVSIQNQEKSNSPKNDDDEKTTGNQVEYPNTNTKKKKPTQKLNPTTN